MLKKTAYKNIFVSFSITLCVILFAYAAITADINSRASGFGGSIPEEATGIENLLGESEAVRYLNQNKERIFHNIKIILPAKDIIFVQCAEILIRYTVQQFENVNA